MLVMTKLRPDEWRRPHFGGEALKHRKPPVPLTLAVLFITITMPNEGT